MTPTNTIATEVPLVFDVDAMASWLTAQRKLSADTFLTAVMRVGGMHGPYLLAEAIIAGAFGKAEGVFTWHSPALTEQAKATASVWSNCDNPSQLLSDENWKALFSAIGYTVDGAYADQPDESVRLYRGATEEGKHGMAWTSDLATAKFFATEYVWWSGHGKVWTAVFEPEHLLAHITTRDEAEYVVDPEILASGLVEIEEYIPA